MRCRAVIGVSLLLASSLFLSACAGSPRVVSNADPAADFTRFSTFGFMQPLGTDSQSGQTLSSQILISAVSAELESRGLRRSEDSADLLVNFFVTTRDVVRQTPGTSANMHWRSGRYRTWRGYSLAASAPRVTTETHGTLVVDLVDAAQLQLVWEGAATQRVTNSRRDNLEATLSDAIRDLFVELPF